MRFLKENELSVSQTDPCLFICYKERKLLLAIYVDNELVAYNNEKDAAELLQKSDFKV